MIEADNFEQLFGITECVIQLFEFQIIVIVTLCAV